MKTQRQVYQELELIFDSDSNLPNSASIRLLKVWQAIEMALHLSQKHCVAAIQAPEQHVLHLKNCLELDSLTLHKTFDWSDFWKRIVYRNRGSHTKSRPRINCFNEGGYQYWYVYKPATEETIFLESEEAAKSCLESYQLKFS